MSTRRVVDKAKAFTHRRAVGDRADKRRWFLTIRCASHVVATLGEGSVVQKADGGRGGQKLVQPVPGLLTVRVAYGDSESQ